jgi:hypothetical protein
MAKRQKPSLRRRDRAVTGVRAQLNPRAEATGFHRVPHNLNFMLLTAQIAANVAPTARNRRLLRIARRRFAERTTGCRNLQRWISE